MDLDGVAKQRLLHCVLLHIFLDCQLELGRGGAVEGVYSSDSCILLRLQHPPCKHESHNIALTLQVVSTVLCANK